MQVVSKAKAISRLLELEADESINTKDRQNYVKAILDAPYRKSDKGIEAGKEMQMLRQFSVHVITSEAIDAQSRLLHALENPDLGVQTETKNLPSAIAELRQKLPAMPVAEEKLAGFKGKRLASALFACVIVQFMIILLMSSVSSARKEALNQYIAQKEQLAQSNQSLSSQLTQVKAELKTVNNELYEIKRNLSMTSISAQFVGKTDKRPTVVSKQDIRLTAFFADGSKETVTDFEISPVAVVLQPHETKQVLISYMGHETSLSITSTALTQAEELEAKKGILIDKSNYDEYARNEAKHLGENVYLQGGVKQVISSGSNYALRVSVYGTKNQYAKNGILWDGDYMVMVVIPQRAFNGSRPLEDDELVFYGTFSGDYTYETVLGASVTIPSVLATDVVMK